MHGRILFVDQNAEAVAALQGTARLAGFVCSGSTSAMEALQTIVVADDIAVIVRSLDLATQDGRVFLDEIDAHAGGRTAPIPIVLTETPDFAHAVMAMRLGASDILVKPVLPLDLLSALRRAHKRWSMRQLQSQRATSVQAEASMTAAANPTLADLRSCLDIYISTRRRWLQTQRARNFNLATLDILLDLALAWFRNEAVPVTSVAVDTDVPLTTALRHVRHLVDAGLVRRWQDPTDRRRELIKIEDHAMRAILAMVEAIWRKAREIQSDTAPPQSATVLRVFGKLGQGGN